MKRFFEEHASVVIICIVISLLLCIIGSIRGISPSETSVEGHGLLKVVGNNILDCIDTCQKQIIPNENILENSAFKNDTELGKWLEIRRNQYYNIETSFYKGYTCAHLHSKQFNTTMAAQQEILNKIKPNTTYTISGYVATENIIEGDPSSDLLFYSDAHDENGTFFGNVYKYFPLNSNSWEYISYTFTTPSKVSNAKDYSIYVFCRNFKGDVYFRNIKLEEGRKTTPFVE